MNTQEIVDRLVELVGQGKNVQAEQELYAADAVSHEMDGTTVTGLEGIIAKTTASGDMFDAFHGGGITKVTVNQDTFLAVFELDVTPKGGQRMNMVEYGFYRVADGKIVEEYFYM